MEQHIKIDQFLDENGKITQLPRKQKPRLAVLEYLSEKFEMNRTYTEHEVNEICDNWHTFGDFFLMRRELVDYGFLGRERNGSKYWRVEKQPTDTEE